MRFLNILILLTLCKQSRQRENGCYCKCQSYRQSTLLHADTEKCYHYLAAVSDIWGMLAQNM